MSLPAPITCRWCLTLATGAAWGKAHPKKHATGDVPHCDRHWDNAYEVIRDYPEHGWRECRQPKGAADTLF